MSTKTLNNQTLEDFEKLTETERKAEYDRVISKQPGRVPVLIKTTSLPDMERFKFLPESGMVLSRFVYVIRSKLKLSQSEALFVFIGNTQPKLTDTLGELHSQYKSNDGFLRFTVAKENTFGNSQSELPRFG